MTASNTRKLFSFLLIVTLILLINPTQTTFASRAASVNGQVVQDKFYYLPIISYDIESYEPNDTMDQAYGPVAAGETLTSVISRADDFDFYYFNITKGGNITVDLTGYNTPKSRLEATLYDSTGKHLGATTETNKTIIFTPVNMGKYYVRVCLCSVALNPPQFYDLKITYNGAVANGDLNGTLLNKGKGVANLLVQMRNWNTTTGAIFSYWTVTNSFGQYHFRGVPGIASNSASRLYVYFDNDENAPVANYIQQAQGPKIRPYTTGANVFAGDLDISPITITAPADNATVSLANPVTFSWTPRSTSGSETYRLLFIDSTDTTISAWSPDLGHKGSFTLNDLNGLKGPNGEAFTLVPGHVYVWSVNAQTADGKYSFSYSRSITFAP